MLEISQCCNNEKIAEVTYKSFNKGKPVLVCDYHWHLKNEIGECHWQNWTKEVKFLTHNESLEAVMPQ